MPERIGIVGVGLMGQAIAHQTSPSIKQAVLVIDIKLLTNFAVFPDPDGPT